MDAQQFGTFIAELRRERGMTQAELAAQLRVTDKAVSRWERGLGFPDINTLEPLARALGIGIDELMRAQRNISPEQGEQAAQAVANTVRLVNDTARQHRRRAIRRTLTVLGVIVLLVAALWLLAGCFPRTDVYMCSHASLISGNAVMIHIGLQGSMGYVRTCRDISDDPSRMVLRFYSAFGGLNSRVGAQNVFVLTPDTECMEIFIENGGEHVPILYRDSETGMWMRVPQ